MSSRMAPNQMLGAAHVNKARAVEARLESKNQWPYWWLFGGTSADDVIVTNGIAMPATGIAPLQALVLEYDVPSGLVFVLTGVVIQAVIAGALNSAFAPGDGSLTFVLDVNQPLASPLP